MPIKNENLETEGDLVPYNIKPMIVDIPEKKRSSKKVSFFKFID